MNLTSDRSKLLVCCLLLFIGTFLLFLPAVHHEFLNYDDDHYITESDLVKQGLTPASAGKALIEPHFFMWHPVTTWSLQLDHTLFGVNPAGYHLMNAIFHSLSCCLVFLLACQLGTSMAPANQNRFEEGVNSLQKALSLKPELQQRLNPGKKGDRNTLIRTALQKRISENL